jgi:pimeloyl-ACP methyl ester carboxylesterase
MPTVEVAGLEIAYRRAGVGPPLVLVHGGASDGREWIPQLEGLAGELTVIAWDEPGSGRSADLPPGFGLADFADVLAGLVAALGLGRAHVGGLSWGGVVALELYRRHRETVGTLILADTYAGWKGSLPPEEVEARVAAAMGDLEAPPEEFRANLPGLFAADPAPEVAALMAEIERDVRPAGFRTLIKAVAGADQRDLLPWIAVPTLLIWGAEDVRSPVDTVARQFDDAIPQAELVVIPEAGHVSNLERPERFNEAVLEFCRAHPPGRSR